jgi:hypothetical protein
MILHVTIEITAVTFRRLNSFEWAVLTMLNTFQGEAPSIEDATKQLSIGEPAFLLAALENMRLKGAVQPKTDEARQLDLKDYEISESGRNILIEDGWELVDEQPLTEEFPLDWPSLKLVTGRVGDKRGEQTSGPSPEQVNENLTVENVEHWLNKLDEPRCWRVKGYYVSSVET